MNLMGIHAITTFCRDVVYGLEHLHITGLTIRDLKPQRVLINFGEPPSAKICDQGIIDGLGECRFSLALLLLGTLLWTSIE